MCLRYPSLMLRSLCLPPKPKYSRKSHLQRLKFPLDPPPCLRNLLFRTQPHPKLPLITQPCLRNLVPISRQSRPLLKSHRPSSLHLILVRLRHPMSLPFQNTQWRTQHLCPKIRLPPLKVLHPPQMKLQQKLQKTARKGYPEQSLRQQNLLRLRKSTRLAWRLLLRQSPLLKQNPPLRRSPLLKQSPSLRPSPPLRPSPLLKQSPLLRQSQLLRQSPLLKQSPPLRSPLSRSSPLLRSSPLSRLSSLLRQNPPWRRRPLLKRRSKWSKNR